MARIVKRKNKHGVSYQATIRRKVFEPVARTFDTKGEAVVWAAGVEQEMKDRRYKSPRMAMNTSLGQALEKYLDTISKKKVIVPPDHGELLLGFELLFPAGGKQFVCISRSYFFQIEIWLGRTLYSVASCEIVLIPLLASIATFFLNFSENAPLFISILYRE